MKQECWNAAAIKIILIDHHLNEHHKEKKCVVGIYILYSFTN